VGAGRPPATARRIEPGAGPSEQDAIRLARAYYLDDRHQFGCAETVLVVLKGAYGLDDPMDSSAAVALNGGLAWSGGPCGALTGAAIAVGMLAERRIDDHARAKLVAREVIATLLDAFLAEHGAVDCRDLVGVDLRAPGGHEAFIASGAWREGCLRQIEFVVGRLAPLADLAEWERTVRAVEVPPEG
jgi:C_GCAxxG_C_C family probable redox protein